MAVGFATVEELNPLVGDQTNEFTLLSNKKVILQFTRIPTSLGPSSTTLRVQFPFQFPVIELKLP